MKMETILQAATRLTHEVKLHVTEYGCDVNVPGLNTDILTIAQALTDLLAERGDYVRALEQIRSAPHTDTSWRERYQDCVKTANDVLNAHADKRS